MKNIKIIKIVSACLSLAGAAISVVSSMLGDKILDDKIENKVINILNKK